MMFTWTDENTETAKRLWDGGLSASAIADEIGGGVSRNAVIGKLHRLGFKRPAKKFGDAGATPQSARAAGAARSAGARKPKVTLATSNTPDTATEIAEEPLTMNSGQYRVPTGPLGREECEAAPIEPSISALPGASSERAVGAGSPMHIMDLRDRNCRRPLWANVKASFDDLFFCGAPTPENSPYCHTCRPKLTQSHQQVAA